MWTKLRNFTITSWFVLLSAGVVAQETPPVAIGYIPGDTIPVRVICDNLQDLQWLVEFPRVPTEAEFAGIGCFGNSQGNWWVNLKECLVGPVTDPLRPSELFSLCSTTGQDGKDYYFSTQYRHPRLKES